MANGEQGLNTLLTSAIAFIVVVLVVAISGLVISEFHDSTKAAHTITITDEQITATNASISSLSNDDIIAVSLIENATNGIALGVANYTVTSSTGGILFGFDGNTSEGTHLGFSGHTVNVTYTLYEKGAWYNATKKDGLGGIEKFSTFLPTIAVVIVSSVLVMIVVAAFVFFRATR